MMPARPIWELRCHGVAHLREMLVALDTAWEQMQEVTDYLEDSDIYRNCLNGIRKNVLLIRADINETLRTREEGMMKERTNA